jgi:dATP/dGTP diphosphohydrolase
MNIEGVGKDVPIRADGLGTQINYRMDLFPGAATLAVAKVFHEGFEKYKNARKDNERGTGWTRVDQYEHLNKALIHAMAFLAGDISDDHAGHFACRAMMFLETHLQSEGSK